MLVQLLRLYFPGCYFACLKVFLLSLSALTPLPTRGAAHSLRQFSFQVYKIRQKIHIVMFFCISLGQNEPLFMAIAKRKTYVATDLVGIFEVLVVLFY